jgi:hypothetical protein
MKPRHRKRQRRSRPVRLALLLAVTAIVVSATYAFAASITVNASQAGDGSAPVSTPTSTVVYQYDSNSPQKIASFAITITSNIPAAGATVRARILSTASMTTCSYSPPTATCTLGTPLQMSQTAPDVLRVVVAS